MLPGERELREERAAVLATVGSLTDDERDHGDTLCEGWTPRDVLAHLIGVDESLPEYARAYGNVRVANQRVVERWRDVPWPEMEARARRWADSPALTTRGAALFLLGDVVMHHQDILRGVGRSRPLPLYARAALLREGAVLGAHRLLTNRVVPTDGGRPLGRGRIVRGSSEALGLWLAGRKGIERELTFVT
jgi:uncharacterized protein (TIGR03083 family)